MSLSFNNINALANFFEAKAIIHVHRKLNFIV
jgi:hypothetical protein